MMQKVQWFFSFTSEGPHNTIKKNTYSINFYSYYYFKKDTLI